MERPHWGLFNSGQLVRAPPCSNTRTLWNLMGNFLDSIRSPADLRKLSVPQLESLAQEIRERLIVTLSKTGGHLGPNLGVVELTLALHYRLRNAQRQVCLRRQPSGVRAQDADRPLRTVRYDPAAGRAERLHAAHGERARLLRRGTRGHGTFRGAGHGGGARSGRGQGACDRAGRGRGVYQRHFVRGAEQHRRSDQAADRGAERQRVVDRPQRGGDREIPAQDRDQPAREPAARERCAAAGADRRQGRAATWCAAPKRLPRACCGRRSSSRNLA